MLALFGGAPMITETVSRLSPVVEPHEAVVVTAERLRHQIIQCVPGLDPANVIAEPVGRNTAPCIALATAMIAAKSPDADPVIGVFAADHHIADPAAFRDAVAAAGRVAQSADAIVTLGVTPTRPETGYGYIHAGKDLGDSRQVLRFVEKPDQTTAEAYLADGRYFWNAGLFFFRASVMQAELDRQLPEMAATIRAITHGPEDEFPARLSALFPTLQSISIDYGVMEGARQVHVVPVDCGWSDVGHLGALRDLMAPSQDGNVTRGDVVVSHSTQSVIINESSDHVVAVVGVDGLVVIHTDSATLVVPASMAQNVRDVVKELAASGRDDLL
jgi:mannose-1-phosphate guanylyltransferase